MGLVFDRVAAKVNNEIITLSSVQERVEVLKAKYQNNKADFDDKKLLKWETGKPIEIKFRWAQNSLSKPMEVNFHTMVLYYSKLEK